MPMRSCYRCFGSSNGSISRQDRERGREEVSIKIIDIVCAHTCYFLSELVLVPAVYVLLQMITSIATSRTPRPEDKENIHKKMGGRCVVGMDANWVPTRARKH